MQIAIIETEIASSTQQIWDILSNLEEYPLWLSAVYAIKGKLKLGKYFSVYIQMPGKPRIMRKRFKVLKAEPEQELWILYPLVGCGLWNVVQKVRFEPLDLNQVRVIQQIHYSGPIFWFVSFFSSHAADELTRRIFEPITQSFKYHVEHIGIS